MWNLIKGLFLLIVGIICIWIPASCMIGCVKDCNNKAQVKKDNTQIQLIVEGPTYGEQWGDGRITSYANVGFRNTGRETVYRVSCNVHFYDSNGNSLGTVLFNYDPADRDPVEYGQSTPLHVLHVTNRDGIVAARIKITDLKVNDYDKPSGYN